MASVLTDLLTCATLLHSVYGFGKYVKLWLVRVWLFQSSLWFFGYFLCSRPISAISQKTWILRFAMFCSDRFSGDWVGMYLFTGYASLFPCMLIPIQRSKKKVFAALLEHFFTMQGPHVVLQGFVAKDSLCRLVPILVFCFQGLKILADPFPLGQIMISWSGASTGGVSFVFQGGHVHHVAQVFSPWDVARFIRTSDINWCQPESGSTERLQAWHQYQSWRYQTPEMIGSCDTTSTLTTLTFNIPLVFAIKCGMCPWIAQFQSPWPLMTWPCGRFRFCQLSLVCLGKADRNFKLFFFGLFKG